MKIGNIEMHWLGHAGFKIKNSMVIYIDPYNLSDSSSIEKADIILITHSHYDHCSVADIKKIVKEGTRILMPADCQSKVTKFDIALKIDIAEIGKEADYGVVKILPFPAYNINKPFHPKDEEWLGYLIKMKDVLVYHAGDSDLIPEMQKLTGYRQEGKEFIAMLPVGGRFTMNAEEAAEAAGIIKPDIAIPMHYGSIIGNIKDAKDFKEFCEEKNINAVILERE